MTQEDKELLLKDLCARLPYGVKAFDNSLGGVDIFNLVGYDGEDFADNDGYWYRVEDCKPYLFPLSSMTDKQRKELDDTLVNLNLKALSDEINSEVIATYEVDFYNKNHFDYRGLIPKGLALDATGLDIYK